MGPFKDIAVDLDKDMVATIEIRRPPHNFFDMELIRQILTIYRNYDFKTQVLVASVRHPQHVVEAALAGGHICTMPFSIFQQMVKHPLTDSGLKKFLADWEKVPKA